MVKLYRIMASILVLPSTLTQDAKLEQKVIKTSKIKQNKRNRIKKEIMNQTTLKTMKTRIFKFVNVFPIKINQIVIPKRKL